MSNTLPLAAPNCVPSVQEISRESLFIDAYGMTAAALVAAYPIDTSVWIKRQPVLNPLIDAMAADGWVFGGAGFFAAVFIKDGFALKIGFKSEDTGAMYAAWCRANQSRPGVPTIYSISKFKGCYVVLMRRYEALREEWLDDDDEDFIPALYEEFRAISGAVNIGSTFGRSRFDTVSTGLLIHDFFKGVVDFDLYEANVMLDYGGELIITDPISYGTCSGYYYTDDTSCEYT